MFLCSFDSLCCASVPLGHVYDQQLNKWLGHPSMPQPFVRLSLGIEKEDYEHFGLQLSFSPDHTSFDAMADTGYQSCLVGLKGSLRRQECLEGISYHSP